MSPSPTVQSILAQTAQAQQLDQLARQLQSAQSLKDQAQLAKEKVVASAAKPESVTLLGTFNDAFQAEVSAL